MKCRLFWPTHGPSDCKFFIEPRRTVIVQGHTKWIITFTRTTMRLSKEQTNITYVARIRFDLAPGLKIEPGPHGCIREYPSHYTSATGLYRLYVKTIVIFGVEAAGRWLLDAQIKVMRTWNWIQMYVQFSFLFNRNQYGICNSSIWLVYRVTRLIVLLYNSLHVAISWVCRHFRPS